MGTVPVHAHVDAHVVTHEDDALGTKLDGQIESMKTRIAPPTNDPSLIDQNLVTPLEVDAFDSPGLLACLGILSELQPSEFRDTLVSLPPPGVAGVEDVCPWAELP